MSNGPFFNTTARAKKRKDWFDTDYKQMHWTKQLALKPLRDKVRKEYAQGDNDNRTDNWDVDNEPQDKQ